MNLPTHPLHPLTGEPIRPIGYRKARYGENGPQPIWPIMGGAPPEDPPNDDNGGDGGGDGGGAGSDSGSGGDGGGKGADKPDDSGKGKDLGFPENTPIADMTAEQQAAYWKHHAQKHESAWKKKVGDVTPEKYAEDMAELEAFRKGQLTDQEKAVEDAKAAGRAEAKQAGNEKVIDIFIAARLPKDKKIEDFPALGALDYSKFIDQDGDVDTDKVAAVLDQLIPSEGGDGSNTPRWPNTGQGKHDGAPQSGMDAGKAEAQRRFAKSDA